jgi:hypothetical protein
MLKNNYIGLPLFLAQKITFTQNNQTVKYVNKTLFSK